MVAAPSDTIGFEQRGIAGVLETKRLRVPLNQREYSWQEEQVEELYEDLLDALTEKRTYFLGTIVLTSGDEVSDGQQRLSTVMVMLAAVRDWFLSAGDTVRAGSIEGDYLFKIDLKTTENLPKLTLNVDDNDFFIKRILGRPNSDGRKTEPTRNSHQLLLDAYYCARKKIEEFLKPFADAHRTDRLLEWVEFLQKQALVIVLSVPDHLNAFVMFETLNDRGLHASQADLIKNHILSLATSRVTEAQQLWAKMLGTLETIATDDLAVTFLHHYLITTAGPTKEREVFDRIKRLATSSATALDFASKVASAATDYAALFNSEHEKWNDYDSAARRSIATINRDLRVQQIRPLMFAVAQKFSPKEAVLAFRMFVNWSVRFLIVGGRGGYLERNYGNLAAQVGTGKIKTAKDLADAAKDIVPSDSEFETSFRTANVSQAYLARYYLRALEKERKGEAEPEWVPSDDEKAINLEHVLPQNPGSEWPKVAPDAAAANYRRIGNMAILQASKNSRMGNKSFAEKTAILAASAFGWTADVATESDWGPFEIEKRQRKLAAAAVKTWPARIP